MRYQALVCWFLILSAGAVQAAPAGSTVMQFVQYGAVPVFRPAGEPSQVVILLSGDQGIGSRETEVGNALAAAGALVFALDVPHYLESIVQAKGKCLSPGTEIHQLGQNGQARTDLPVYHPPILVGVGSGGALAFATLALSAPGTWTGVVSLGFCPVYAAPRPFCPAGDLQTDPKWPGPGVRFLPDRDNKTPWIVLDEVAAPGECPSAPAAEIPSFIAATPGASRVPQSAWKTELPKALAEIAGKRKEAEAARRAHLGDLADLPLVEVPATAPEIDAFAVDVTGSGGYEGLDVEIGDAMAEQGVPLVALSSPDYFWTTRDAEGMSRDLARILEHYLKAWHKSKVVLIGYSQGADVIPYMVTRLPEELRAKVASIGLVGPDDQAELDMGLSGFRNRKPPATLPVISETAETARLKGHKVVCVYGKREKHSICPALDPALRIDLLTVGSGHGFSGRAPEMIERFLTVGGLPVRAAKP
ncbi:MAG TPA: AcvB/VirJ family lysyl-phosphatidylglycerol hydrolase [Thermoanaerobaculia bacterium]|jgi:type IV secretory pathway VirJ component|nr:AcvB/VirJ family lysyl-phosphatidylglycerol hydrolase [Thermoanaerobaculia bacterium]